MFSEYDPKHNVLVHSSYCVHTVSNTTKAVEAGELYQGTLFWRDILIKNTLGVTFQEERIRVSDKRVNDSSLLNKLNLSYSCFLKERDLAHRRGG